MAGLGRRTFQAGEVLTASNVMAYLQDQAVMNFAGTAARGSAIGTAVSEGMVSYLADNNFVQAYDGTAWRSIGGVQVASGTATRDALLPTPIQGDTVFRNDLGYEQTYYGAYNSSTNPGGRASAGWYNNQRNMGLVPIVPPTVNFSGGTATANSLGSVTFSSVTNISFNNVFTSAYQNYRMLINFSAFSAQNDVFLRMRASGSDSSASYHYAGNVMNTASASGNWVGNNVAGFHLHNNSASYGNRARNFIEFWDPAIAINTKTFWNSFSDNGTVWQHTTVSGTHTVASSYDGFTLYPSSGNMTGTITVYGYNS